MMKAVWCPHHDERKKVDGIVRECESTGAQGWWVVQIKMEAREKSVGKIG